MNRFGPELATGKLTLEQFDGDDGVAVTCGLAALLLVGVPVLLFTLVDGTFSGITPLSAAAGVFMLAGLGAAAVFLLRTAREASARYFVDDERIIRRDWGRTIVICWRDLADADESGTSRPKAKGRASGRCVLHGAQGQRLAIPFAFVVNAERLRSRLEPHLAAIRQQQQLNLAKNGGTFRPTRSAGVFALTWIVPMFLITGVAALTEPFSGKGEITLSQRFLGFFAVAGGLGVAVVGLEQASRTLMVNAEGVALKSLFRQRSISWERVESVAVKAVEQEEDSHHAVVDRVRIVGDDGQSITIDSWMPGYVAVLGQVRSRCGAKVSTLAVDDPEFF